MSIDKSLRRKNTLERTRSVMNRGERIAKMMELETWQDGQSPYGLPKTKVVKIILKKAKKAKDEKAEEGAAAPAAAAGKAPAGKAPAGKAPAGKAAGGKGK
jgi:small basic protein (TIGR04137 family)